MYFKYVGKMGFSVSKGTIKIRDWKMTLRRFVCCREGYYHTQKLEVILGEKKFRKIRETRCGCEAYMRINLVPETDKWVVGFCNDNHNHSMVTPSKRRYSRSSRLIPSRSCKLFKSLKAYNFLLP